MASLGGLDVAYGASLQLVRTNVLVVDTDATTTQAEADVVHSIASQKWVSSLQPDYTCFSAIANTSGATRMTFATGYAVALTDQVESNILKDLSATPLSGSQRDGTAANNRGLAIEAILSVGVVEVQVNDTAVVDDLFLEGAGTTVGEEIGFGEFATTSMVQSAVMKTSFDAGLMAQTMDLELVVKQTAADTGTKVVTGDLSALTDTSTAAALNDAIGDAGTLVSVMALGRVL